jgi:hypothetical protein
MWFILAFRLMLFVLHVTSCPRESRILHISYWCLSIIVGFNLLWTNCLLYHIISKDPHLRNISYWCVSVIIIFNVTLWNVATWFIYYMCMCHPLIKLKFLSIHTNTNIILIIIISRFLLFMIYVVPPMSYES